MQKASVVLIFFCCFFFKKKLLEQKTCQFIIFTWRHGPYPMFPRKGKQYTCPPPAGLGLARESNIAPKCRTGVMHNPTQRKAWIAFLSYSCGSVQSNVKGLWESKPCRPSK